MSKIYKPQEEDSKLIQLKYAAPQIGTMSEDQVNNWGMALLLKIHVITGWVIPTDQLLNILLDQFKKKLVEDYSILNTEEIEYAFRKSGTSIQDWGKQMNLNLIDQVLSPYVDRRLQVSADEERMKSIPPPQRIYTEDEMLNERRGHIEQAFQAIRVGNYPILFDYFKPILVDDELMIEEESVGEFFVRKINSGAENLYIKCEVV